jgi:hypothetical protein
MQHTVKLVATISRIPFAFESISNPPTAKVQLRGSIPNARIH